VTKEQENFLSQVAGPALESERTYGIPACIVIAQSILESAAKINGRWTWGGSVLFREANNPFGIKDRQLADDYGFYEVPTTEYSGGKPHREIARFEKFRSLHDAFACHASLIATSKTYQPAMAARADWRKFAELLGPKRNPADAEHCGYATDPNYAAKLKNLVVIYHLEDRGRLNWYASTAGGAVAPQGVEGVDR
jgi:flagellum-specific peptidoglycan hydrolase FlgJ